MAKKTSKKSLKRKKVTPKDHVVVTNKSYGNRLRGTKIYFEFPRPKWLQDDGRMKLGKHILEILSAKFERFRWTITRSTDEVVTERGIVRVRTSQALINKMGQEEWNRVRDIKTDIVRRFFSTVFPSHFQQIATPVYVPGTLSNTLDASILPRLSSEDRDALNKFIPDFVASESIGTVQLLKASAQIETLSNLAADLEKEIDRVHAESWWQDYIKSNILLMQQGYIRAFDKLNVALGDTKYPDFALITHDNYLDILEIKRPDTLMLKEDTSRKNDFWDVEMAKAISQTENYIDAVTQQADRIRSYFKDEHNLEMKAVRPRGIILAGNARAFAPQKKRDDFRLLSHGIKNISILTYDELLNRLKNYITVLEDFCVKPTGNTAPEPQATSNGQPNS